MKPMDKDNTAVKVKKECGHLMRDCTCFEADGTHVRCKGLVEMNCAFGARCPFYKARAG
jgi:hypothetical protein